MKQYCRRSLSDCTFRTQELSRTAADLMRMWLRDSDIGFDSYFANCCSIRSYCSRTLCVHTACCAHGNKNGRMRFTASPMRFRRFTNRAQAAGQAHHEVAGATSVSRRQRVQASSAKTFASQTWYCPSYKNCLHSFTSSRYVSGQPFESTFSPSTRKSNRTSNLSTPAIFEKGWNPVSPCTPLALELRSPLERRNCSITP